MTKSMVLETTGNREVKIRFNFVNGNYIATILSETMNALEYLFNNPHYADDRRWSVKIVEE